MRLTLAPLLAILAGCAPSSAEKPPGVPSPTSTAPGAAKPIPRETSRGARPWAAEDLKIPPGKLRFTGELFAELPFNGRFGPPHRISPDAIGFLDSEPGKYTAVRVLATRTRVQRFAEPSGLTRLCVAKDGKITFAVGERNMLLYSTTFDAPMRPIGTIETETNGAYLANTGGKRNFIDCKRGTIDDMSSVKGWPRVVFHSETMTLISFQDEVRRTCRMRAGSASAWEDVPRCSYAALEGDGLVRVYVETPDGSSTKCGFALDAAGKRRPCPVEYTPKARAPQPPEPTIDFRSARFASPELLVAVGNDGLYALPVTGARSDLKQIAQGTCSSLSPIAPIFRCFSEDRAAWRIVAVDAEGKAKDELKLATRRDGEEPRFFEAGGGALAMSGECDGTRAEAVCVRHPNGEWKTAPFPGDLIASLHRTAPRAAVMPAVNGDVFIATGAPPEPLGVGPLDLAIYKADKGFLANAGKVPLWLDAADGSGSNGFLSSGQVGQGAALLWRSATMFSVWPLVRAHPAFQTFESCRFDVTVDGASEALCVPGHVRAIGRFGMRERKPGEMLETYDGGESWSPVPLPEGVDTHDIDCAAIGCRIGPYFRLGWGV